MCIRDRLHSDLPVAAVLLGIGRRVGEDVLVPDRVIDGMKDVWHLALESGKERHAAGHARERGHLVIGLEVVDPLGAEHAATSVAGDPGKLSRPDAEDGDVGRRFDLLQHLIQMCIRDRPWSCVKLGRDRSCGHVGGSAGD